jgi:hypothetical protein
MELDWFGFGSVGGVWAWALLFFSFFLLSLYLVFCPFQVRCTDVNNN